MRAMVSPDEDSYSYTGMGYANPHAVSQIANGLSTTSLQYDNNGNLIQKTTDGIATTYVYDYANRLIALGSGGATTTYGYDAFDARFWFGVGIVTHGEGRIAKNLAPYEKVVLNVGPDVARFIGDQYGRSGTQNIHPFQQFNTWAFQPSSQVNLQVLGQSIGYSLATQQPSYSGGSNPNYSSQT